MADITKEQLGQEDILWETAGAGTGTGTTRTSSTGAVVPLNPVSSEHVPVLDAPVAHYLGATGSSPFSKITPATDRDVEECLRDIRTHAYTAKNFEHYGGVPGSGKTQAVAQFNTSVWKTIEDELRVDGGGIVFFPSETYEFEEYAALAGLYATHCLPWNVPNTAFIGTPNTILQLRAGSTGKGLMYFHGLTAPLALTNIMLADLQTSMNSVVGLDEIGFTGTGDYLDIRIYNVKTNSTGFNFANSNATNRVWLKDCSLFVGDIQMADVVNATVQGNILSNGELAVSSSQGVTVAENWLAGTNRNIEITGAGSSDRDLTIINNRLTRGNIELTRVAEAIVAKNQVFSGSIDFTNATSAVSKITITDNVVTADSGDDVFCIRMNVTSEVSDVVVSRNRLNDAQEDALLLATNAALLKRGLVSENLIHNPSRALTNGHSGITVEALSGANTDGTQDFLIINNNIRSDTVGLLPAYGIEQNGASTSFANTYVHHNYIRGYVTAALTGASFLYPIYDAGGPVPTSLTAANIDGGAAP